MYYVSIMYRHLLADVRSFRPEITSKVGPSNTPRYASKPPNAFDLFALATILVFQQSKVLHCAADVTRFAQDRKIARWPTWILLFLRCTCTLREQEEEEEEETISELRLVQLGSFSLFLSFRDSRFSSH